MVFCLCILLIITNFSMNLDPIFRMKSLSFCPHFAVGEVQAEKAMRVLHSVSAFALSWFCSFVSWPVLL